MGHTDGTQTDKQAMAQNHLLRRGNRYFFRRRVPAELWEIIGKKEIKKALGTSCHREAKRLATIEALKSDELFASKQEEVKQVSPPQSLRRVGYGESVLLVASWYRQLEEDSEDWLETNLDIFQNPDELRLALETAHLDEHVCAGGGEWGWGRRYQGESGKKKLMEIFRENGVDFAGTDVEFRRLAALVRKSYLENARNDIKRLNREPLQHTSEKSCFPMGENSSGRHFPFTLQESQKPHFGATVGEILDEFMGGRIDRGGNSRGNRQTSGRLERRFQRRREIRERAKTQNPPCSNSEGRFPRLGTRPSETEHCHRHLLQGLLEA